MDIVVYCGTSQSIKSTMGLAVILRIIGPRGDSLASSQTTTTPTVAACLFKCIQVEDSVEFLSIIFLNAALVLR